MTVGQAGGAAKLAPRFQGLVTAGGYDAHQTFTAGETSALEDSPLKSLLEERCEMAKWP